RRRRDASRHDRTVRAGAAAIADDLPTGRTVSPPLLAPDRAPFEKPRVRDNPEAVRGRALALPWGPALAGQGRGLDPGRWCDAMTVEYIKIAGGTVYDPANGNDGEVRDIWIAGGKVVEPPSGTDVVPSRVIDATGLVVMPGGVDMHCHIVGSKVNAARM